MQVPRYTLPFSMARLQAVKFAVLRNNCTGHVASLHSFSTIPSNSFLYSPGVHTERFSLQKQRSSLATHVSLILRQQPVSLSSRHYRGIPKWQRRLEELLERDHYPPPPKIPQTVTYMYNNEGMINEAEQGWLKSRFTRSGELWDTLQAGVFKHPEVTTNGQTTSILEKNYKGGIFMRRKLLKEGEVPPRPVSARRHEKNVNSGDAGESSSGRSKEGVFQSYGSSRIDGAVFQDESLVRHNKENQAIGDKDIPSSFVSVGSSTTTLSLNDYSPKSHPAYSKRHPIIPSRKAFVPPQPSVESLTQSSYITPLSPIWSSRRSGVLAYKLGCTSLWDEWGQRIFVTICQIDRCSVMEVKTLQKHGYEALVMGCGYRALERQSKPNIGRYIQLNTGPKHVIKEFKCSSDAFLPVGHEMSVRHFTPGQWVFVSGWSKAKGFMGPMKRWGFAGDNASHGTEGKAHRGTGSISQGSSVNVVWKFKKMAGHHGPDPRVVNCKVFRIESERNLLFLQGAIPGHKGSVVKISDARGRTWAKNKGLEIPFPTFIPETGKEYSVTVQCVPSKVDPFFYQDVAVREKE